MFANDNVSLRNLVVNGWYRWNCEHEISPFLVYRVNELEIHVLFINHGKGYVASFFTRLIVEHLRILPTTEIPSDDILKSVCAQFNSTNANMSQLIQFERGIKTLEPYLLHRLSFDPAHPCKLVVRELEWNAKNKAMNLIPTWNKETEAAIADWKAKYPQLPVFVCQKINTTSETMAFKCPRCGQIHTHGLTDGLRNSQCEYLGTSYIVIEEK